MTATYEHRRIASSGIDDVVVLHLSYKEHRGAIPVLRIPGAEYLYTDELGELFVKSKQRLLAPSAVPDGAFVGIDRHRYTLVDKERGDGARLYAMAAARIEAARETLRDIIAERGYKTVVEREIVN